MEAAIFDDVRDDPGEIRPRGISLKTMEKSTNMKIHLIQQDEPVTNKPILETVILPNGRIACKL